MAYIERNQRTPRRTLLAIITGLLFLFLLFGFIRLQILEQEKYRERSLSNSVRKIEKLPVRGLILDRDGDILVDNRPAFVIAVVPREITAEGIEFAAEVSGVHADEIRQKMKDEFGFHPIVIARDVSYEQVVAIEENSLDHPGVLIRVESKRFYPDEIFSPHIFGTIGEVTEAEIKQNDFYQSGDLIGKNGLEKIYDTELRGEEGVQLKRVNASGKILGDFDSPLNSGGRHGRDLFLALDYELQSFAESLFVNHRGSLVAIDPRNGSVLAMVTKPDYDPRLLAGQIRPEIWQSLLNDKAHPLYNRSIQNGYPPGSTYKIVAAIAALQEKLITPAWSATCPGYFQLGRRTIHCWNLKGHGTLNLQGAIRNSCNVYFFKLGLKIGLDTWAKYSELFGFGSRTGIDLPNESKGLVPTREYYNRRYGNNGWTSGHLANLAIGQGELLTTPLQIAQFVAILANRGFYYPPHLTDHFYEYDPPQIIDHSTERKEIPGIDPEVYQVVLEGMRQVMDGGTGSRGKVEGIEMAGKTGTAQNPHGQSHAWFMAFAPYTNPEIAIAVILENAGGGGANAAPLARKVLEKHFFGHEIIKPVIVKSTPDSLQNLIDTEEFPFPEIQPIQIMPGIGEN